MECKVVCVRPGRPYDKIGIYPEWNVKFSDKVLIKHFIRIGIYPEWNVKSLLRLQESPFAFIGIYPEWNVKAKGA